MLLNVMTKNIARTTTFLLIALFVLSCQQEPRQPVVYHHAAADYSKYALVPTGDTLKFHLDDETFGNIESWSIRQADSNTIIAFFDQLSGSIVEYAYPSGKQVNKIDLLRFFKPSTLKSAYLKNYDSIYITTHDKVYLIDSSGNKLRQFEFGPPENRLSGKIAPESPISFMNDKIYIALSPGADISSKYSLRNWKVMWSADLCKQTTDRQYGLPAMYEANYHVGKFVKYTYCLNDSGRFVFSFAGDTMLYETDLGAYNHAWFAKSNTQNKPVPTASREKVNNTNLERKQYMTNQTYGPVFYDKIKKRYLRVTKPAISEEDFEAEKFSKTNRVIIMDENFNIIGESDLPKEIYFSRTFFTPDGGIYTFIKVSKSNAINFLRMEYREHQITAR